MIASFQAEAGQVVGDLVRATAQVGEAESGIGPGPDVDDAERDPVPVFRRGGKFGVEPVDGPVEHREVRPCEAGPGRCRVGPVQQQDVTRLSKAGHQRLSPAPGAPADTPVREPVVAASPPPATSPRPPLLVVSDRSLSGCKAAIGRRVRFRKLALAG